MKILYCEDNVRFIDCQPKEDVPIADMSISELCEKMESIAVLFTGFGLKKKPNLSYSRATF